MGYFRKLWRKAKKKISLKSHHSDLFDPINTNFERISEKCPVYDVFDVICTSCERFTEVCLVDDCSSSNNNVFSTLTSLKDRNQDCLEKVLSFLTCKELAASAMTCKTLQRLIFEGSNDEVHINMIWHGAELGLINPRDRLDCQVRRFGANAREHCHLFMIASKAAEAYEQSAEMDEIEEDRMMVDGVLVNLMNVRGFDAEGVAKKKAMARGLTPRMDDDDFIKMLRGHDRALQRNDKRCTMPKGRAPPKKMYHHKVFVRITRASTGKVISQGFCERRQTLPWNAGLEFSDEETKQSLGIILDFKSLQQADEVQSYIESGSTSVVNVGEEQSLGLHVTAVVVNGTDRSCQCLFQQDQLHDVKLLSTSAISNFDRNFKKDSFDLRPMWDLADTIQLGPSPYIDPFFLGFNFSLNTRGSLIVPVLEVVVEPDRSELLVEILRRVTGDFYIRIDI